MNSRKVVFVPTLHSVFNHETKHNEVKPFSAEETETLLSFLRDPKALLTSGDTVDFSVPMTELRSHPRYDYTFGQRYCGVTLPATVKDTLVAFREPNLAVRDFIYSLIGAHSGTTVFRTEFEIVVANDQEIIVRYLKDHRAIHNLVHQCSVKDVEDDFPFQDREVTTWANIYDYWNEKTKTNECDISTTRQQWRELFVNSTPVGLLRRSPINPVEEFTPAVRHEVLLELAINPSLVKEIYLTAFRGLALKVNDPSFQFPDFLAKLRDFYHFQLPVTEGSNKPAINWDCTDHVAALNGMLKAILLFDELQERNQLLTKHGWLYDPSYLSQLALETLPDEQVGFYQRYSRNQHHMFTGYEELKYGSPEEAAEAAVRYEQILNELPQTQFTIHYL